MTAASVGTGPIAGIFRTCTGRSRRGGRTFVLALFVAVLALATALGTGDAEARRYASLVIDADTGRVLYSRNADTKAYPASLTKMMTLLLTFEALEDGRISLDTRLPVSRRAEGQPPSKLGLKQGETIAVNDAIRALAIKSANDVATVVAEALGETEIGFGRLMTKRARELGMDDTTFVNASGLYNARQVSSARDMATLARVLIQRYPSYYHYFSESSFSYKGRTYSNHNKLLGRYAGTDGLKTGYISASGFNLVTSVKRNGVRLIGVVFGGKTGRSRDAHMQALLDRSWDKAGTPALIAAVPIPKPLLGDGAPVRTSVDVASAAASAPRLDLLKPGERVDWGIQVGAFLGFNTAHDAAANAADRLADLPDTANIEVLALETDRSTLYRARIIGMGEREARHLCRQIRDRGRSCVIVTPDGDIQLAGLPG